MRPGPTHGPAGRGRIEEVLPGPRGRPRHLLADGLIAAAVAEAEHGHKAVWLLPPPPTTTSPLRLR